MTVAASGAQPEIQSTPKQTRNPHPGLFTPQTAILTQSRGSCELFGTPPPDARRKRASLRAPLKPAAIDDSSFSTPAKTVVTGIHRDICSLLSPSPNSKSATQSDAVSHGITQLSINQEQSSTEPAAVTPLLRRAGPQEAFYHSDHCFVSPVPTDRRLLDNAQTHCSRMQGDIMDLTDRSELCILDISVPSTGTIAGVAAQQSWCVGDLLLWLVKLGHLHTTVDVVLKNRCTGEALEEADTLSSLDLEDTYEARFLWEVDTLDLLTDSESEEAEGEDLQAVCEEL